MEGVPLRRISRGAATAACRVAAGWPARLHSSSCASGSVLRRYDGTCQVPVSGGDGPSICKILRRSQMLHVLPVGRNEFHSLPPSSFPRGLREAQGAVTATCDVSCRQTSSQGHVINTDRSKNEKRALDPDPIQQSVHNIPAAWRSWRERGAIEETSARPRGDQFALRSIVANHHRSSVAPSKDEKVILSPPIGDPLPLRSAFSVINRRNGEACPPQRRVMGQKLGRPHTSAHPDYTSWRASLLVDDRTARRSIPDRRTVMIESRASSSERLVEGASQSTTGSQEGELRGQPLTKEGVVAVSGDVEPVEASDRVKETEGYYGPPGPGEKPRVVVLGSGWAACRFLRDVDTTIYDVVCISPRNHMVFTPLLASTCVGTLEFRSVAEPVRNIQPSLSLDPNSHFFLAKALEIDADKHEVECEAIDNGAADHDDDAESSSTGKFRVYYDKLVIATGAQAMTFNIQGVKEHAIFLREVGDAVAIRRRLLLNLMKSDIPGTREEEKRRLLHCVVVGGGPTGVEFSGELSDFIMRDVKHRFTHVKDDIKVTLIEARDILSSFDVRLRQYAIRQLTKSGVDLVKGVVKEVKSNRIVLTDGQDIPYGLLVWSTGVGPSPFVRSLGLFPKSPGGRIGIDEWLRVVGKEDVWSAGDCCGYVEETGKSVLPALAQVAERQGRYIAMSLNKLGKAGCGPAGTITNLKDGGVEKDSGVALPQFVYRHLGSMATVGRYKALIDLRRTADAKGFSMEGFISWLVWRSVYLTRVISWRNRLYVAVNWGTTFIFGRDITRI